MRLSAKEMCSVWNKALDEFDLIDLQSPRYWDHADEIACSLVPDGVKIRVGPEGGHVAIINLKRGRLLYSGPTKTVENVVKRLLESGGARCTQDQLGLHCDIASADHNWVVWALASATSMRDRLVSREDFWNQDNTWETWQKCSHITNPEDFEFCAVEDTIKRMWDLEKSMEKLTQSRR